MYEREEGDFTWRGAYRKLMFVIDLFWLTFEVFDDELLGGARLEVDGWYAYEVGSEGWEVGPLLSGGRVAHFIVFNEIRRVDFVWTVVQFGSFFVVLRVEIRVLPLRRDRSRCCINVALAGLRDSWCVPTRFWHINNASQGPEPWLIPGHQSQYKSHTDSYHSLALANLLTTTVRHDHVYALATKRTTHSRTHIYALHALYYRIGTMRIQLESNNANANVQQRSTSLPNLLMLLLLLLLATNPTHTNERFARGQRNDKPHWIHLSFRLIYTFSRTNVYAHVYPLAMTINTIIKNKTFIYSFFHCRDIFIWN